MISSKEFFINIKDVPPIGSKDYEAFFLNEFDKIENGITINGIHYSGWLYWHLNHWKILIDIDPALAKNSRIKKKLANPELRDNEWIIANHIEKAHELRSGLLIVGCRQFAKTQISASYIGYNSITIFGSQNMYAASNETDVNNISAPLKRGYKHLHPYFKPLFLEDKWKPGSDVVIGFKDTAGERYEYSRLLLRNHNLGRNTEVGAGSTLNSFVIDEIGKSNWLKFFEAVKPAFASQYGWRCSPIATGTTGSMEDAKELEKVYKDMEGHKFISVEINDDLGNKYHFFPGPMSLQFPKKRILLKDFINQPQLKSKRTIQVTQWSLANTILEEQVQDKIKKRDYSGELKVKMYYPRTEGDMFLTDSSLNPFSDVVPFAKEHLTYLESIDTGEEYGWMTRDEEGKAKFIPTKVSYPIQEWPTGVEEDRDAPIIIWDHPLPGQEFGVLHVAGSDPYNHDESYSTESLGTLYIYRRTYDPLRGKFQESFVASYTARPKSISKWREQVRLLLEYYDCTCLPENEEGSFIRWFDEKMIAHYLEDGLQISKEINPNTKNQRNKGLPATLPNIRYGNGLLRNYFLEDLVIGQDPEGHNIVKKGIIRCKDKGLLKEVIGYKYDPVTGKATNADRIVGARHALILARSKDKFFPIANVAAVYVPDAQPKKIIRTPFSIPSVNQQFGLGKKIYKSPFRRLR